MVPVPDPSQLLVEVVVTAKGGGVVSTMVLTIEAPLMSVTVTVCVPAPNPVAEALFWPLLQA